MLDQIYRGFMTDQIQCKECGYVGAHVTPFLDLPLVIRSFAGKVCRSVEESLALFVEQELMTGSEQYNCEKCQKRTDALKGFKLKELPKILTLQLKRFDFDWNLDRRIKINDLMTFPMVLDMNPYLDSGKDGENKGGEGEEDAGQGGPEGGKGGQASEKRNTYELFSVLVHSGSAMGGHYYAYIKDLESGKWFNFNDSNVSPIEASEISNMFGEGSGVTSANPMSASTVSAAASLLAEAAAAAAAASTAAEAVPAAAAASPGAESLGGLSSGSPDSLTLVSISPQLDADSSSAPAAAAAAAANAPATVSTGTSSGTSIGYGPHLPGGATGTATSAYSYKQHANAYMLVYRVIDPDFPPPKVTAEDLPEVVRAAVAETSKAMEEKRVALERAADALTLRVHYGNLHTANVIVPSFNVEASRKDTLSSVCDRIHQAYVALGGPEAEPVPRDCVRLWRFSSYGNTMDALLEESPSEADMPVGSSFPKNLYLEVKAPGEQFRAYSEDEIVIRLIEVDLETLHPKGPAVPVFVDKAATVAALRAASDGAFGIPAADMRLIDFSATMPILIDDEAATLTSLRLNNGDVVAVECISRDLVPGESPLVAEADRRKNKVTVTFGPVLTRDRAGELLAVTPEALAAAAAFAKAHPTPGLADKDMYDAPGYSLEVDKRKTLGELRAAIGAVVGLPADRVVVRRNYNYAPEFRKDNEPLSQFVYTAEFKVQVEDGRCLHDGELWLTALLFTPQPGPAHRERPPYASELLCRVVARETSTWREVRAMICAAAVSVPAPSTLAPPASPEAAPPASSEAASDTAARPVLEEKAVYFRDIFGSSKISKVMPLDATIKDSVSYIRVDGHEVGVFLYDPSVMESRGPGIDIMFERYRPLEEQMDAWQSLFLPAGTTQAQLFTRLSEALGIPAEDISLHRPPSVVGLDVARLLSKHLPWVSSQVGTTSASDTVDRSPLYLSDGEMVVCTSSSEIKEARDRKDKAAGTEWAPQSSAGSSLAIVLSGDAPPGPAPPPLPRTAYQRPAESALKIRVHKAEQHKEKEKDGEKPKDESPV